MRTYGKYSTVMKVFHSIVAGNKTRALIADDTALSVMTVGTVVDMLIELDVLSQRIGSTGHVGAKTRYIEPRKCFRTAVFSVSEAELKLYLVDISGNIKLAAVRKPSDTFSFENDLLEFVLASRDLISGVKLIGIGVLICKDFTLREDGYIVSRTNPLLRLSIYPIFKKYYGEFDVILSDEKSKLLGHISDIETENSKIFALFIDDEISCSSFRGGDEKITVNDCGKYIYYNGRNINDFLFYNTDIESQVEVISELLMYGILLSSPDKVYLDGDKYSDISSFCKMVIHKTENRCLSAGINMPEFICPDRSISAISGIAALSADQWLIDLLTQKDNR